MIARDQRSDTTGTSVRFEGPRACDSRPVYNSWAVSHLKTSDEPGVRRTRSSSTGGNSSESQRGDSRSAGRSETLILPAGASNSCNRRMLGCPNVNDLFLRTTSTARMTVYDRGDRDGARIVRRNLNWSTAATSLISVLSNHHRSRSVLAIVRNRRPERPRLIRSRHRSLRYDAPRRDDVARAREFPHSGRASTRQRRYASPVIRHNV